MRRVILFFGFVAITGAGLVPHARAEIATIPTTLAISSPEPGLVRFLLCSGDECIPLIEGAPDFKREALERIAGRSEAEILRDPSYRRWERISVFLGTPGMAMSLAATLSGVVGLGIPVDVRTALFVPGIALASFAMWLDGRATEKLWIKRFDAEILRDALEGDDRHDRNFTTVPGQALRLREALLRLPECRAALI